MRRASIAFGLTALLGCATLVPAAGPKETPMDALAGKTWTLMQFDEGSPAPAERAITAVFEDGKISGSGGCNRYTATLTVSSPGTLKVGPIAATKKACMGAAGANEQRYFSGLEKAEGYALEDGRLVLSPGRMVFESSTSSKP